ncbi:MAG: flagellar motor switch protein FliG [Candidatus Lambdaproteobacteria bacterium RIFOXYD2_FULL_50_16]|uniref:Flagellar motor switch protein FliG n=1 Tax=Candidatus Lambdaproteobacteria bacterium RIFOXYD2_FULL_50_16 TaxID=1817772 RepID=A0A1F6GAL2_9PROT|nr:MAG: flagellar motor switch protein FliG [Candidatus Lambdaproteobacteria bacterium RIFOXYD2_FULL_50_16]
MAVGKLTGPKKAAILLLALGEDGSADVIKNLEDREIQQVGYYMARFTDVAPEELDNVLEEFYRKVALQDQGVAINASGDFVKNAISKALGDDRAKDLVDNLKSSTDEEGLDSLKWLEPKVIAGFIMNEHPQTISLILAHLEDPEQTAMVLKELPENLQADVTYRMAILEAIPPGVVKEIEEVLAKELKNSGAASTAKVGGIESVAEMLNTMDKSTESRILATIEESNPDLAEQIRELMFTFEDLVLVDPNGMQLILKEVPQNDLVLALKTASDALKEHIFSNMSERAADMVRDDLEALGAVRVADVDAAQQKLVKVARKLEEEGKIIISGGGGGDVV